MVKCHAERRKFRMNNDKLVEIGGMMMPISRIRHWQYCPEEFIPNRSDAEAIIWSLLVQVKKGWNTLESRRVCTRG